MERFCGFVTLEENTKEYFYSEKGIDYRVRTKIELNYISGNKFPYFSITAEVAERNRTGGQKRFFASSGGCCHEQILKANKNFADIVAFHLRNIFGGASLENAIYWAGIGKNGELKEENLKSILLATSEEVEDLLFKIFKKRGDEEAQKEVVRDYFKANEKRWKEEADRLIEKYDLVITGNTWFPNNCYICNSAIIENIHVSNRGRTSHLCEFCHKEKVKNEKKA